LIKLLRYITRQEGIREGIEIERTRAKRPSTKATKMNKNGSAIDYVAEQAEKPVRKNRLLSNHTLWRAQGLMCKKFTTLGFKHLA